MRLPRFAKANLAMDRESEDSVETKGQGQFFCAAILIILPSVSTNFCPHLVTAIKHYCLQLALVAVTFIYSHGI